MTNAYPFFPAHRIALISRGELIGDALMKIPFLRAVREVWPAAEIHWVISEGATPLSTTLRGETMALIDHFHIRPVWLETKRLDAPKFDLVIDTRDRWKDALKARWRVPHKLFIAPAARYLFSQRKPANQSCKPVHLNNRLKQTIELAAGFCPALRFGLSVSAAAMEKASRLVPADRVTVGLAPGAGGAVKKWPLERYVAVAQEQVRKSRVPVFLLGPQESDLVGTLREQVPEALFPLQAADVWGDKGFALENTLAVASRLSLAVSNDSGLSHMLWAMQCPLITLFGPTCAEKIAPQSPLCRTIKARDFGCRAMDAIPVESVLAAIEAHLASLKKA